MNRSLSKKITFLAAHNRELLIGFGVLLVLAIRFVFPAQLNGEVFWINLVLFFVFPWLIVRFLLKEDLGIFGIAWGDRKKGIALSIAFLAIFGLANYFVMHKTNLRNQLQISPDIIKSFWVFLWFQLIISLPSHFFWEFFFRGFLQLGLEKKLGKYAIFLQALAQTLLFAKSSWIIIFLIASSSLAAGAVTWKSRSIFYSFIAMWLISVSLDIMIIRFINQGII